jgi:hypothetical protein
MPDTRVVHHHGPARSLYGDKGPVNSMPGPSPRPMTTTLRWPAGQPVQPESIAEHLDSAIARVPGLSSKQKAAIHAVLTEKMRDIHFLRLVSAELGPKPTPSDEGRML